MSTASEYIRPSLSYLGTITELTMGVLGGKADHTFPGDKRKIKVGPIEVSL
jgi:hypothetical protein